MISIPMYSQRGVSCSAVIGQGQHLMIYSSLGLFHISFANQHASDFSRTPALPSASLMLSLGSGDTKPRRDAREKKMKALSPLFQHTCSRIKFLTQCDKLGLHEYWFQVWRINAECCPWLICGLPFPLHILIRQSLVHNQQLENQPGLKHEL